MCDQNVKYGFLSCFNRTWFVKALENDSIAITPAFACDGGNIMRAYGYFMYIGALDANNVYPPVNGIRYRRLSNGENEEENDSPPEVMPKPTTKRCLVNATNAQASKFIKGAHVSNLNHYTLCGFPVHHQLCECCSIIAIGSGRLGSVLSCNFQGKDIAINWMCIKET